MLSIHRLAMIGMAAATSLVGACHSPRETLHTRAVYDLQCSSSAVSVANIGGNQWVAQGCNAEARYICTSADDCVRVDSRPAAQYAAVAPERTSAPATQPAGTVPPSAPASPALPPYGGQCMGLGAAIWDIRVDEGIGPISLGMTRGAVEGLGLVQRPGAPQASRNTAYFGPLYVVFKDDRVSNVQYAIGCDGGGAKLPDGSIVYKGTDFRPLERGLGGCTTTGEIGEGASGATRDCGQARRTHIDLTGGCAQQAADGTCDDWRGKRDMIRIVVATKW
jgi:hypothetical protein